MALSLTQFSESIPVIEVVPNRDIELVASKIDGCLFPGEETFLAQLAEACIGKGVIVEIGSYLGRSTVSLGLGSMRGSGTMILTFDHFQGDPFMEVVPAQFETLKQNIKRAGVDTIVLTSSEPSDIAVRNFKDPIELLFIDANHTFEAVEQDFQLWSPKVVMGGVVAFHDTYDTVMKGIRFDGPLRVIQKYCQSPDWKIVGRFQSITVVMKVGIPAKKVTKSPVVSKSVQKRHKVQKGLK